MPNFDVFLTQDRETCVREDDPRAAFLLMAAGSVWPSQADKDRYEAQVEAMEPKEKAVKPVQDKAVKPAEDKGPKTVRRIVQKSTEKAPEIDDE